MRGTMAAKDGMRIMMMLGVSGVVTMTTLVSDADARDLAADLLPSLTVVEDHGGIPARPYFVAIGMAGVEEEEGYVAESTASVSMTLNAMLPVESPALSPGYVDARSLSLPKATTPFFLIGDDALSREWLQQRYDVLRQLNAVGLVVNVENMRGLQQLRERAPGLDIRPVAGDDIAQRLAINHYPVLITSSRLEQ